jgi:phosphoribosylformylglycinamidine synthase
MGAAGLTCSTCETASRGGTGVEIDIQLVPQRAKGQTPYEVLLSESQERMLVIVKKGQEDVVKRIFEKWDLPYAEIGTVTDDGMMRVRNGKDVVVEIPARALADDGPLYFREAAPFTPPAQLDLSSVPQADPTTVLPKLLSHPSIASKRWVWRQYDHMVRTGTAVLPGSDAAVFIVREANKILAAATDCNAVYCKLDPTVGARIAVAECARNLACSGAVPLGVTDNLNFGNPHKPENFYQLRAAVEGISEGCRAFNVPVTGGNVSLYNESPAGAIDPTPTISMVGRIDDAAHITTQAFKEAGDQIFLIGETGSELGASHYLLAIHGRKEGAPPALDFEKEKATHAALLGAIRKGLVRSAHDCSEGGLAVTLAESCFGNSLGAAIDLGATDQRPDVVLFNETQGRIVISVKASDVASLEKELAASGVPFRKIGEVTAKADLSIKTGANAYNWSIASLNETFEGAIPKLMES